MAELALEMGMPIGELGDRMSNYELNVIWPAFYEQRRQIQEAQAENERGRRR